MLLRTRFVVTLSSDHFPFDTLPLEVVPPNARRAVLTGTSRAPLLELSIEQDVERDGIRIAARVHRFAAISDTPSIELEIPEHADTGGVAQTFVNAVTTSTRIPMRLAHASARSSVVLEPESEADERLLAKLGTRTVSSPLSGTPDLGSTIPLTARNVEALMTRPEAVRLYSDSIGTTTAGAQVRELWRVLESAFCAKDRILIDRLVACPLSLELEFDREDFRALHSLRGRVSHAESRKGQLELARAEAEATRQVPRLRSFAEALICHKQEWGSRSLATSPFAGGGYVGPDGRIVMFQSQVPLCGGHCCAGRRFFERWLVGA